MADRDFRTAVLRAHGAGAAEADELLAYTARRFTTPAEWPALPLPDEPFAAAWEGYAALAEPACAWEVLRARLPQLRFPVEEGISATDEYRAATLRGEPARPPDGRGLRLNAPDRLRLFVHPTPAGRLPVLVAGDRDDFVALVRALAHRNEPAPVPTSMGALAVGGFANWDRLAALRRAWEARNPGAGPEEWRAEFRAVVSRKELYQDRFVILSEGPYSGVPAAELGMDHPTWLRTSLVIRLEHECAHYFSRRVLGAMSGRAHDELVADYAGITAAARRYRAGWALRFLGLEARSAFREGGRLGNYRGDPPLSEAAFAVLGSVVRAAVRALARFDAERRETYHSPAARGTVLGALFGVGLEEMAAVDGVARLRRAWSHACLSHSGRPGSS